MINRKHILTHSFSRIRQILPLKWCILLTILSFQFSIFNFQLSIASAQESATAYNFLRLPVSAHVAAVGGDNITLTDDDATLIFHNPALINGVSDKTINLNFMTYMEGAKTASAAFVKGAGDRATWGVTGQYMDYGTLKQTNEYNEDLGTFTARDWAIGGTFAYALTNTLSGGITARFISSHIAGYNSMAVGVDLGLNYYDDVSLWSISAVARNLGGQVKAYDDEFERIPFDLQLGVSKQLKGAPLRFHATMSRLTDWSEGFGHHFAIGADIREVHGTVPVHVVVTWCVLTIASLTVGTVAFAVKANLRIGEEFLIANN